MSLQFRDKVQAEDIHVRVVSVQRSSNREVCGRDHLGSEHGKKKEVPWGRQC